MSRPATGRPGRRTSSVATSTTRSRSTTTAGPSPSATSAARGSRPPRSTGLARHTLRARGPPLRVAGRRPAGCAPGAARPLSRRRSAPCASPSSRRCPTARIASNCRLGGHPQPLLRRADGTVEAVGAARHVVGHARAGRCRRPSSNCATATLFVLYTDGLTDAPAYAGRFGRGTDLSSRGGGRSTDRTARRQHPGAEAPAEAARAVATTLPCSSCASTTRPLSSRRPLYRQVNRRTPRISSLGERRSTSLALPADGPLELGLVHLRATLDAFCRASL